MVMQSEVSQTDKDKIPYDIIYIWNLGFSGGSVHHLLTQEMQSLIPGLGRSAGEGNGQPTPVFLPGKSMYRGAWWAIVHRLSKSQAQFSD